MESAGIEPGKLDPFVVRALQGDGIDISGKKTQNVFDGTDEHGKTIFRFRAA